MGYLRFETEFPKRKIKFYEENGELSFEGCSPIQSSIIYSPDLNETIGLWLDPNFDCLYGFYQANVTQYNLDKCTFDWSWNPIDSLTKNIYKLLTSPSLYNKWVHNLLYGFNFEKGPFRGIGDVLYRTLPFNGEARFLSKIEIKNEFQFLENLKSWRSYDHVVWFPRGEIVIMWDFERKISEFRILTLETAFVLSSKSFLILQQLAKGISGNLLDPVQSLLKSLSQKDQNQARVYLDQLEEYL